MRSELYQTPRPSSAPARALPQIGGPSRSTRCYVTSAEPSGAIAGGSVSGRSASLDQLPPSDAVHVHYLSRSVAVRAARAFGEWPGRRAALVQAHADALRPYPSQPTFTPDLCDLCVWCSQRLADHELHENRCDELALRAAWGDR